MKKEIIQTIKVFILGLVVMSGVAFANWNSPANAPTANNADAPIDVSLVNQLRTGGLYISNPKTDIPHQGVPGIFVVNDKSKAGDIATSDCMTVGPYINFTGCATPGVPEDKTINNRNGFASADTLASGKDDQPVCADTNGVLSLSCAGNPGISLCQDNTAQNYLQPIPCTYCGDVAAVNYHNTTGAACQYGCHINSFVANPGSVYKGGSSTLSWSTSYCNQATLTPTVGSLISAAEVASGTRNTGALTTQRTYTLSATGLIGSDAAQVTVSINPPGSEIFTVGKISGPCTIPAGCHPDPDGGVASYGLFKVQPGMTSITIDAWGAGGGGGGSSRSYNPTAGHGGGGGGGGAHSTWTMAVTPGQTLQVYVGSGGQYGAGYDGSASSFGKDGTFSGVALSGGTFIAKAGGGAGGHAGESKAGGYYDGAGGAGGALIIGNGNAGNSGSNGDPGGSSCWGGWGGNGGSSPSGGVGGGGAVTYSEPGGGSGGGPYGGGGGGAYGGWNRPGNGSCTTHADDFSPNNAGGWSGADGEVIISWQ